MFVTIAYISNIFVKTQNDRPLQGQHERMITSDYRSLI